MKEHSGSKDKRDRMLTGGHSKQNIVSILSPSHKSKGKSPLSGSKHQTAVKANVSYGQLQIILENIHKIREKAGMQVKVLLVENKQLKEEVDKLRQQIQELRSIGYDFQREKDQFEQHFQVELSNMRDISINLQGELEDAQVKNAEKEHQNVKIKEQLNNAVDSLRTEKAQRQQQQDRYNSLANLLTAGQAQRIQQLQWALKNEHPKGLFHLFKTTGELKLDLQLKLQQINQLQDKISEAKMQASSSTSIVERVLEDYQVANAKMTTAQEQIRGQLEKIRQWELKYETETRDLKTQLQQSNQEINVLRNETEARDRSKSDTIEDSKTTIHKLTAQLSLVKHEEEETKKKRKYESLVDTICEEGADYVQLVEKIRYLERFRNEHYFNVEKIQFLCKMLDN